MLDKSNININFTKKNFMPIGLEDIYGGEINNKHLICCGFGGQFNRQNKSPYWEYYSHRTFYKIAYLYDFDKDSFEEIGEFPGDARQAGASISINNEVYCWGGFSYTPSKILTKEVLNSRKTNPNCYKDGFKLSFIDNKYIWSKLPDLPYEICFFSICYYDNYIYIFGGQDYDRSSFYSFTDRNGENENFGSRFFRININQLDLGWERLDDCYDKVNKIYGTPRGGASLNAIDNKIYLFGGFTGRLFKKTSCSVIDNWYYDLEEKIWVKIDNLPNSLSAWSSIKYKDRYIFFVGGSLFDGAINSTSDNKRFVINSEKKLSSPFGEIRQIFQKELLDNYGNKQVIKNNKYARKDIFYKGKNTKKNDVLNIKPTFSNEIFLYDTKENKFEKIGDKESPLPLNMVKPQLTIHKDTLYIFGGEIDISLVENTMFLGCTDIVLSGNITFKK